ncbi:MAG: hypothetical protein QM564_01615 [Bergeyella sp.]
MKSFLIVVLSFFLLPFFQVSAQNLHQPKYLNFDNAETEKQIIQSLETLFSQIEDEKIDTAFIGSQNRELTIATLGYLKGNEDDTENKITDFYKRQIINIYPVSKNQYTVTAAYIGEKQNELPVLKTVFSLTANVENNKITFTLPLSYLTRNWKSKTIGNITYHFPDEINAKRAKQFNLKNTVIANKLKLQPDKLDFYLCENYQHIIKLLGYDYDLASNGKTRNGYGVDGKTIFSVMHNEDFSHDLFHYYSAKIRKNKPNRNAEEGVAYIWGNAYWTKSDGENITQKELVSSLKNYLKQNPETSLIELFDKNPKILNELADEVSVKSTLAGLICDDIERKKGTDGIITLLNCGSGEENFFNATKKLVNIDRSNFNTELMKLINDYK